MKTEVETKYYDNGQKESETNYKNGKEEGLRISWHSNGQKQYEGHFKNGKVID